MDQSPQTPPEPQAEPQAGPPDPEEFQIESPAETAETPVVYGTPAPPDPDAPTRWEEQEAPPRVRPLPPPGAVRIAWSMRIEANDGVVFEADQDCVHKNMDSERMRTSVDSSILDNIRSSLINPLNAHVKAFGNDRLKMSTLAAQPPEELTDVRLNPLALPATDMPVALPAIAPAVATKHPDEPAQG